jgi:radical SAM protein with 4Fe4S-binding SPASM domain
MDEIAAVNRNVLLILTGGEPLLRPDVFDLGAYAADKGFTVVLGTNGFLLRQKQAKAMRQYRIEGASISLDSTDPSRHDAFRRLPGAWQGAIQATESLRAEGLPFSLHMSVTDWNVNEIPAMIDLARTLGTKVLNLFFLVRTGRPSSSQADTTTDDPWGAALGRAGDMLIRAKCAPFFRRILYGLDPASPLLRNYAEGSCPAGRHYCRIMPDGDVTACPYMPAVAGNLRRVPFDVLWREAALFNDLRGGRLGGRCGACEFSKVCGGCRCRAYATYGDYLAEDPACAYQPGAYGGHVIELPAEQTFGIAVEPTLTWTVDAQARLGRVPGFARGMVIQAVERQARAREGGVVTAELMQEVRQRMLGRFPWFAS